MVSARILRMLSCRGLYLRRSRATVQLFSAWISVCLSPQSGQASVSFFPQSCKLALCAKVSTAALRMNRICWGRRDWNWMVFAHISISFPSTDAITWSSCFSSFSSCDSLLVLSFTCTLLFTLAPKSFPDREGSSTTVSWTVSASLKIFLGKLSSCWRCLSARRLTLSSGGIRSWLCHETCIYL